MRRALTFLGVSTADNQVESGNVVAKRLLSVLTATALLVTPAFAGGASDIRLFLASEGVEVHESGRGGDVTYHGPGQLVGYPIIRLDLHGRDVHRYLRDLEEVLIRVLARFGIEGTRAEGMTGVWVGAEKVAAIGVAISRWVTWHGVAINVDTNLDRFDLIVPCGIRGRRVTSLGRLLGRQITVAEVKPHLVECMVDVFGFDGARPGDVPPPAG